MSSERGGSGFSNQMYYSSRHSLNLLHNPHEHLVGINQAYQNTIAPPYHSREYFSGHQGLVAMPANPPMHPANRNRFLALQRVFGASPNIVNARNQNFNEYFNGGVYSTPEEVAGQRGRGNSPDHSNNNGYNTSVQPCDTPSIASTTEAAQQQIKSRSNKKRDTANANNDR